VAARLDGVEDAVIFKTFVATAEFKELPPAPEEISSGI